MLAALDLRRDLVAMPFVSSERLIPPDLRGKLDAETWDPIPDRLIGYDDASGGQKILDILRAARKPMVRPYRAADHRARKAISLWSGEIGQILDSAALHLQVAFHNLTMPLRVIFHTGLAGPSLPHQ